MDASNRLCATYLALLQPGIAAAAARRPWDAPVPETDTAALDRRPPPTHNSVGTPKTTNHLRQE